MGMKQTIILESSE